MLDLNYTLRAISDILLIILLKCFKKFKGCMFLIISQIAIKIYSVLKFKKLITISKQYNLYTFILLQVNENRFRYENKNKTKKCS